MGRDSPDDAVDYESDGSNPRGRREVKAEIFDAPAEEINSTQEISNPPVQGPVYNAYVTNLSFQVYAFSIAQFKEDLVT
jgi:hypothetical protein